MELTIKEIMNFPNGLAISWNDNKETFIDYIKLRESCPCAHCSGESDIFGNVYKGKEVKKMTSKQALKIWKATSRLATQTRYTQWRSK